MKQYLRRTLPSQVATYEELFTLFPEIFTCLYFTDLCSLFDDTFNPSYFSPGHLLFGEPVTQLNLPDFTDVKCNRLPGGKLINNKSNSFGNIGHTTTSRVCNSFNAGTRLSPTYNRAISSCWGRTTRLH